MKLVNRLIDKFQATFPPNRIVVLLTPLAFVPTAGALSAWIGEHFPGVELPEAAILGLMAAGALAAFGLAYKWLDHWQLGEGIDVQADVSDAIEGLLEDPDLLRAFVEQNRERFEPILLDLARDRPATSSAGAPPAE